MSGFILNLIFTIILTVGMILVSLIITSCDIRESALIREQTETFTGEIREKNKDMQLLSNQLEVAEEEIRQLKKQLLCREELIDEEVDQAKRDLLKDIPVLDIKKPNKSNKAEAERANKG